MKAQAAARAGRRGAHIDGAGRAAGFGLHHQATRAHMQCAGRAAPIGDVERAAHSGAADDVVDVGKLQPRAAAELQRAAVDGAAVHAHRAGGG